MRIAIFTDLYLEIAGGIPSSIAAQKRALVEMGHKVTVFCPGYQCDDPDVVIVPTSWLKINGAPMGKFPGRIIKFLEEKYPNFGEEFDVIHAHYEAEVSIAAVKMAKKYKIPLVQTMHGREDVAIATNLPWGTRTMAGVILNGAHKHYLKGVAGDAVRVKKDNYLATTKARRKMWELMVREANSADVVLAPAQHFATKLKHYGVRGEIRVLSNGVSDALINAEDWRVRKFDKKYATEGEKLRIVWTTRVSREKRIIPFLEALKKVREHSAAFYLTVIGDGNDMKAAREFVSENGLSENVSFLGEIPHEQVLKELKNQHISVTNSFGFDVQPLTLLEATAMGVPVLYCDEDMETVVLPGTGVRAADETPEAMAALIRDILREPDVIEEMSKRAMEVRAEALQSTQIKKLEGIYQEAVKRGAR